MKHVLQLVAVALCVTVTGLDLRAQTTWSEFPISPDYAILEDVAVLNDSVTVGVGQRGCIVRSSSRTLYRDRLTLIRRIVPNTHTETLRSVVFTTGEDFVAVGEDGRSIRGNALGGRVESSMLPARTSYSTVAANGAVVLAGGIGGNLARSSDGGATWQTVPFPSTDSIHDISHNGNNWYVVTNTSIYVSSDASWIQIPVPAEVADLRYLSIVELPMSVLQLVICDKSGGVWTSDDRGVTWGKIYPKQNFSGTHTVEAFDVDITGRKLAIILVDAADRRSLLTSHDAGAAWQSNKDSYIGSPLRSIKWTPSGSIVACARFAELRLYTGNVSGGYSTPNVFQHTNITSVVEWNGEFIISMSNGIYFVIVSVDSVFHRLSKVLWTSEGDFPRLYKSSKALFVTFYRNEGRHGFACRSTDDGRTWINISDTIQRNSQLNIESFGSSVLLRDTRSHSLFSSDDGETRTISQTLPEYYSRYESFAFLNETSWIERVYDRRDSVHRWLRTTDAGVTWSTYDAGPYVSDVVFSNGNIYGVTSLIDDGRRKHVIYVSHDLGGTWSTVYENVPSGFTGDPGWMVVQGNRLVAYGHAKALYISDNGGLRWRHDTTASSPTVFQHNAVTFTRSGRIHTFSNFANVMVEGGIPTSVSERQDVDVNIIRVSDDEVLVTNSHQEPQVHVVDLLGRFSLLKAQPSGDGQWRITVPYNLRRVFLVVNGVLVQR